MDLGFEGLGCGSYRLWGVGCTYLGVVGFYRGLGGLGSVGPRGSGPSVAKPGCDRQAW